MSLIFAIESAHLKVLQKQSTRTSQHWKHEIAYTHERNGEKESERKRKV